MRNVDAMRQFIQSEIEKHKYTYDPDNMRDLVDLYIQAEKNDFKDTKGMNGTISFSFHSESELTHAHLKCLWLSPAPVTLYIQNTLLLEPEWPINV